MYVLIVLGPEDRRHETIACPIGNCDPLRIERYQAPRNNQASPQY
jgi:hypothetical protein